MLILDPDHRRDYYDSVLGLGVDKTLVYRRKNEVIDFAKPEHRHHIYDPTPYPYMDYGYRWERPDWTEYTASPILVGVGGKVYAGYKVVYMDRDAYMRPSITKHVFDIESLKDIIRSKVGEKALDAFMQPKRDKNNHRKWCEVNCKEFFSMDHTQEQAHYFTDYKVPTFVLRFPSRSADSIELNPSLKDIEFFRVLDPFTAFQDISMFLSGVLGVGEPEIVKIGDIEKAKKHGFDKRSFRTDAPGKKANRRIIRCLK